MQLIYKNTVPVLNVHRPIFLLCVFRDEILLLEHFIAHYRALGITHFIMIDNLSTDGGAEYLKQIKDVNMLIYRAEGSFKEAGSGTYWITYCLQKYCINQYCLIVDADELFVYDSRKFSSIQNLIDEMEQQGANCLATTLIDMYPKVLNNDYQQGGSLLQHSPYFDDWNDIYYRNKAILYEKFFWRIGGMRARVMGIVPWIQKFSFFKYNFYPVRHHRGYHMFQYNGKLLAKTNMIKLFPFPAVLLHFKYVKHNLVEVFKEKVSCKQYWNDSYEYKFYLKVLEGKTNVSFYHKKYSKKLTNVDDLTLFFKAPLTNFNNNKI